MSEYDLNYKKIKDKYNKPSYDAMVELYSEGYRKGLTQGIFDRKMLEIENSQLKMRIEKAIEYIENETDYHDKAPIEGSWLYTIYEILKILKGDKE